MEDEKEDPDSKQASPLSSIAIFYGVLTLYWIDALFKRILSASFSVSGDFIPKQFFFLSSHFIL